MGNKQIVESLIEANKKINQVINKLQNEESSDRKASIDDINGVIRQLDHIVEHLEQ